MGTTGSEQDEPGSDCGETPGSEDDEGGDEGEGLEDYYSSDEDGDDRVLPPVGHLVFFVAAFAPFVAAQLMGIRTTDEGIREVCGHRLGGSEQCGCVVRETQGRQKNTKKSLG